MTEAVESLKSQFAPLSVPERADLAHYLLSHLEPEDDDVEKAWQAEIARRAAEIRAGTAMGRPVEEALADLRRRYP
jgi:putative addiction module component (TIGR02574 family)